MLLRHDITINGWRLTMDASGGRSGMQFIESSIVGLRSAVTTFTRPATPLLSPCAWSALLEGQGEC
jgi:hypothetical protein